MSNWWKQTRWLVAALLLGVLVLTPRVASAHTSVDVADGAYTMEIGFLNEPAIQNQQNAIYLKILKYGSGGATPADGLVGGLTATVEKDGQSKKLDLVPQGNGEYTAAFFPTAVGDYTFKIGGAIDNKPIDVNVTSSPTTFDSVQPASNFDFPAATAAATNDGPSLLMVQYLAIAGVVVGVIGLVIGALALARAGRTAR